MIGRDNERALNVLVVEDDRPLVARVTQAVAALGWQHRHVESVQAAREVLARESVDLIYLDRMLADGEDGLNLLAWFRDLEGSAPATLVASRLSGTNDRICGLDQGADDYLDKPFDDDELKARFRALARRLQSHRVPQSVLILGRLELRTVNRIALWAGQRLEMMPLTFTLLEALAAHRGEWVSRQALWRIAWPEQARVAPRNYVINVAISRLREVLERCVDGPRVETGERLGYRLVVPA